MRLRLRCRSKGLRLRRTRVCVVYLERSNGKECE
jgi:hypothetical protein